MTHPPFQLRDGNTLVVSPTQLSTAKACPRMWAYNYLHRRVRAGSFAARDGGKAIDAALNRRYREAGSSTPSVAVEERMLKDIDDAFAGLDLPLDEYRTATRYKDTIRLYNEQYGDEPFDVLGVQVPFEVEVGRISVPKGFWLRQHKSCKHEWYSERPYVRTCRHCCLYLADYQRIVEPVDKKVRVVLHGILDLLARYRSTGVCLVVDTKSSKDWGTRSEADYDNNLQMKAYAYGVPKAAEQARARGVLTEQLALLPEKSSWLPHQRRSHPPSLQNRARRHQAPH